ncbi:cobalt-factor II C(20)-methyltransferase [Lentilactobacillus raoultii]|uniref:Cobalt-factor II C(20)-methyltransferase n=1 Tax=Lentilactobacillus raoultii TaxID=1987503 RepID=A0ABW3PKM9_9LACO|nr:cobalt-factor II C(20)-methyltransferase [Lentilactobacillus raoultii]
MSIFYGIGVGPGDSELMTVKAIKAIQRLDIVYTPKAHRDGISLAEKIASSYFPKKLIVKRRHFPMTKNLKEKQTNWRTIAQEIVEDVQKGYDVGFVTLGDPSVYSTYSYLLNLVRKRITVKTIAGISSFSQIAASVSIPLALDNELLEVIPATAKKAQIEKALDDNDNVVIMKIAVNFPMIYQLLVERHLLNQAIVVADSSMSEEKIYDLRDVSSSEKLPYFSTLLLKKSEIVED